ncbi:hypothetical protein, partial [Haematomicrobium sanguinis]|uniref:hypothetical protein n=1 Tax=Haematomicrobium sanguinis TaxID=479106 RepID=UPI001969D52E
RQGSPQSWPTNKQKYWYQQTNDTLLRYQTTTTPTPADPNSAEAFASQVLHDQHRSGATFLAYTLQILFASPARNFFLSRLQNRPRKVSRSWIRVPLLAFSASEARISTLAPQNPKAQLRSHVIYATPQNLWIYADFGFKKTAPSGGTRKLNDAG